jgi:hypothetical protein
VQRDSAPRRAKGQGAAADASDGAGAGQWWDGSDCAATLTKQNANGAQRMPDKDNLGAVLTPFRAGSIGGYTEGDAAGTIRAAGGDLGGGSENLAVCGALCHRITNTSVQEAAAGHLIAVPFRKSKRAQSTTDDESWVEAEQANTLNAFDTGERDTHAVAFAQNVREEVRLLGGDGSVAGACSAEGGTHQTTYIARVPMANIDMQACKGNANIGDGSVSPTLCKPSGNDVHAVAIGISNQPTLKFGDQVCPSLDAKACGGGRMEAVAIGTDMYNHAITGDVAATMGTPGSSVNASGPTVMQAHGFYSTGGTHGVNQHPEVSPAVKVGSGLGIPSPPAVAFSCKDHGADAGTVAPTMRAMPHDGSHANGGGQIAVAQTMTVRRLTPRECERLQAFPDDYTLIPWRKKPADQCPDGPRYKALGNSMAVNCMEWIGERIAAYEAKERKT